jgi:hypothetical protein
MTGSYVFPRVQVIPQVERAGWRIDGVERVAYDFGSSSARPFLFPLIGPSGALLTRMGHPDPIGHEHHKSVWFGHQSVAGLNFWEERSNTDIRIRQRRVRLYHDGHDWGGLVADLDWWGKGKTILRQELTIVIEPAERGGFALDLQSRFEPPDGAPVELGQTDFGFLGVRVAKTISEEFGGGRLTADGGARGAAAILGKPVRWVDYSGPSAPGKIEGICYMDHPSNPNHPARWHVRRDGWMVASFNRDSPHGVAEGHPLDLRYRLLVHSGPADGDSLDAAWQAFAGTPPYAVQASRRPGLASLRRGGASA